eukprot:6020062-Amphidinium_carterae.1
MAVADGVENGFPLVGQSDLLDYFPVESRPPRMTVDELRSSSRWSSRATASSMLSSASRSLDVAVTEETAMELKKGWLDGPWSLPDLLTKFSHIA